MQPERRALACGEMGNNAIKRPDNLRTFPEKP
jgi:hypothetical protein